MPALSSRPWLALSVFAGLSLLLVLLSWGMASLSQFLCQRYGPTRQDESQCLLCGRYRTEKWVGNEKVTDQIVETAHSRWIDTFYPPEHEHYWQVGSQTNRSEWFGSTVIGCGGSPVLATIYHRRSTLGEATARQLVHEFQQLVLEPGQQSVPNAVYEFEKRLFQDPPPPDNEPEQPPDS